MNILSLFDGMSCLQIALSRQGIKYNKYYASEVDKYAIKVTLANYPDTIQIGDVRNINTDDLPFIDFLGGGSPCQSFSFAGKRKGMSTKCEIEITTLGQYLKLKEEKFEFEGQSYLFWEYVRIKEALQKKNPNLKFLLENVMMGSKWQKILTQAIGVNPICINSALVSAQNRERLYWTNIYCEPDGLFGDAVCKIPQPKDLGIVVSDILEDEVNEKYYLDGSKLEWFNKNKDFQLGKSYSFGTVQGAITLTARQYSSWNGNYVTVHNTMPRSGNPQQGGTGHLSRTDGKTYCLDTGKTNVIEIDEKIRQLTPMECERLQTVPDGYTNHVSDSQCYKMLGNGWTIDTIVHILSYLNC